MGSLRSAAELANHVRVARFGWLFALVAATASNPAVAQEVVDGPPSALPTDGFASPEPVAIPALTGPIELDGVIDEPAWDAIEPFPVTVHFPVFRGEQTEATELRATHDDRYLFEPLGSRCRPDPVHVGSNRYGRSL